MNKAKDTIDVPIKEGYALIKIGYTTLVVKNSKAASIVQAFADAEHFESRYYAATKEYLETISHITHDLIEIKLISDQKYKEIKMKQLLNKDSSEEHPF